MSPRLPADVDPRTPVLVGVGQLLVRDGEAPEPAELMAQAVALAAADAGDERLAADAQVVAAVPTFSWRYRDPGRIVAERLGSAARTWTVTVGGNSPQMLLNRLALAISRGELDLAVLCGAESGRTRSAAKRDGRELAWTRQGDDVEPDWTDGAPFLMAHPVEVERGILMPTQCYPLFENALWHDSGRSLSEHLDMVGHMWAGFSRVAASNPNAWIRQEFSAAEITTPTPENRMVGFPYTKRMVSNPQVDMASGIVVCSAETAAARGIPTDRWVFLHAGTDGTDRKMSERNDFVSSASIRVAGRRVLELAGTDADSVAHLDLYSCFPSAVQLALRELDIPAERQLTVYGGLSFAGGPWNNPVGHALCAMVEVLRDDPASTGLVTANGGIVDKHAFGVFSTSPPAGGFRYECPQDQIEAAPARPVDGDHEGTATLETWTVLHARDGSRERAIIAALTPDGARTWAGTEDPELLERFETEDVTGTPLRIDAEHVAQLA